METVVTPDSDNEVEGATGDSLTLVKNDSMELPTRTTRTGRKVIKPGYLLDYQC